MTATFPTSPDALDPAWLAIVIGGDAAGWTFESMPGGYWSRMVRARHPEVGSVVCKFADPSDQARFVCGLFEFNRVEIGFFRDLAADCPVRVPAVHHIAHAEDHAQYAIVMEDLGDLRQFDQLAGCPIEVAGSVVDALAVLHARHWDDPAAAGLDWVHGPGDPVVAERLPMVIGAVSEQAFANLPTVPTEIVDAWPRVMAALPSLLDRLADRPATLAHGDVRLSNLFVGDDGEVALCDWQVVRHTHGAYDLAYFLTQSLDIESRRQHETALLDRYRRRLHDLGVDAPTHDELHEAYRLCALYCLVYPIIAASNGTDDAGGTGAAEALAIADRAFAAAIDLDVLTLI